MADRVALLRARVDAMTAEIGDHASGTPDEGGAATSSASSVRRIRGDGTRARLPASAARVAREGSAGGVAARRPGADPADEGGRTPYAGGGVVLRGRSRVRDAAASLSNDVSRVRRSVDEAHAMLVDIRLDQMRMAETLLHLPDDASRDARERRVGRGSAASAVDVLRDPAQLLRHTDEARRGARTAPLQRGVEQPVMARSTSTRAVRPSPATQAPDRPATAAGSRPSTADAARGTRFRLRRLHERPATGGPTQESLFHRPLYDGARAETDFREALQAARAEAAHALRRSRRSRARGERGAGMLECALHSSRASRQPYDSHTCAFVSQICNL